MPSSGGGQGTPITVTLPDPQVPYDPSEALDLTPNCAVSLPRYVHVVGYDEAALWGVLYEGQSRFDCNTLWTESSRTQLQVALAVAQRMIEKFIGFPLCPTWVTGRVQEEWHNDFDWVDQQKYKWHMVARYPRIIAPGIRATAVVAEDIVLTHDDQFGTVGPLAVTFTDPNEVVVLYPNSSRRIYPSSITIESGMLTLRIPRYRMVVQDLLDTPVGGILYEDIGNFLSAVDILRVYNDPSRQGVLVRPGCLNNNCSGGCDECTHDACIYVRDPFVGQVEVKAATWNVDSLTWNSNIVCGTNYTIARLNYLCGMQHLDLRAEKALIGLAHTLLHTEPCSCDWLRTMWEGDREYPKIMTREILNNPFGMGNGAWLAYCWAKSIASVRMSVL